MKRNILGFVWILYCHENHLPPPIFQYTSDVRGTRSYEMAKRFVTAAHEVHMITSHREEGDDFPGWLEENIDGIHVHWLAVPYSNKMGFIAVKRNKF